MLVRSRHYPIVPTHPSNETDELPTGGKRGAE